MSNFFSYSVHSHFLSVFSKKLVFRIFHSAKFKLHWFLWVGGWLSNFNVCPSEENVRVAIACADYYSMIKI